MKSTGMSISQLIFEQTNPNYTEFQKKSIEYYKNHAPEKPYEEESNEDLIHDNKLEYQNERKNDEGYEEKLYYNFQTMRDINRK